MGPINPIVLQDRIATRTVATAILRAMAAVAHKRVTGKRKLKTRHVDQRIMWTTIAEKDTTKAEVEKCTNQKLIRTLTEGRATEVDRHTDGAAVARDVMGGRGKLGDHILLVEMGTLKHQISEIEGGSSFKYAGVSFRIYFSWFFFEC